MDIDPELVSELQKLAATDRMRALALLRTRLKCSLPEAVGALKKLIPAKAEGDVHAAEVYAVGPYSSELRDSLDYPAEYYGNLKPGMMVIVSLANAYGREEVDRLGAAFGIDAADFNQHHLKAEHVEVARLAEDEITEPAASVFEGFRAAGFSFHFFLLPPESEK